MKPSSPNPTRVMPMAPSATAPPSPTAAAALKSHVGSAVPSGRPRSSSSACAAMPTARKKASNVAMSVVQFTRGAIMAPSTT